LKRTEFPPSAQVPHRPGGRHLQDHDNRARDERVRRLGQPEPLKARRKILHPGALRPPSQAVAQRDHRREGDDNRRHAKIRHQASVERSKQRPGRTRPETCRRHRSGGLGDYTGDHAADREHRPDRDVDVAGQDYQRRADRDDQHRHVSEKEIAQVLARKVARRNRSKHHGEQHDHDGD
jgi:hypothetical protein